MYCDTVVIEDHLNYSVPCACTQICVNYPFIYIREHTGVYLLCFTWQKFVQNIHL
jgi:hypothetical protein